MPDGLRPTAVDACLRLDGAEVSGWMDGERVVLEVPDGPAIDLVAAR